MPFNHLILCHSLLLLPSIFPSIRVFSSGQQFPSGGQNFGVSASVLPKSVQGCFPLRLTGFISLLSKGLSRVFSRTTVQKHKFFGTLLSLLSSPHPYMTTGKTIAWIIWTFVDEVMSSLFNTLSRCITAFLPGSNCLLISWMQSMSTVILEPKKMKCPCFHLFPFYLPWSDETRCHDLSSFSFLILSFKLVFFFPTLLLPHYQKGSLVPLHFLPLEWYHLHIWSCWYFSQQSWFWPASHQA